MRVVIGGIVALWLGLCGAAWAEPFPPYHSLAVNDDADILPADSEALLTARLDALRSETGIEATVLTLPTRHAYDPADSLESFATRLFNGWGIGDATRNDGILILVLVEDREMRIELGSGYSPEYDIPAQDIINLVMLPAFRDGRMAEGIEAGTDEVITRIAERHAGGMAPDLTPATNSDWIGKIIAAGLVLAFVASALRTQIWKMIGRLKRCPKCGAVGLRRTRVIDTPATADQPGTGHTEERCRSCDWSHRDRFSVPHKSRNSGGSFGGGRSSGGGASGRW
jgi:uncharacterized protein